MAKGLYTPTNPQKYMGDPTKIRFLSAWELRFMHFCDNHPDVVQWGSEEFKIPYVNPIKKKVAMYIPDFIVKYKKGNKIFTEVVEIKPAKEAVLRPRMSNYDKVCLVINTAKWQAARIYCDKYGVTFRILTEKGSMTVDQNGMPIMLTEQGLFKK